MVHKLLEGIVAFLQAGIPNGTVVSNRITSGKLTVGQAGSLPSINLYVGKTTWTQELLDSTNSTVRPQDRKDRFVVSNPGQGPYTLPKTPLEGSLLCQVVFNENAMGEHRRLMLEKKDFTLNYATQQLIFTTDISAASAIYVQYSFPGVYTLRSFEQDFFMDVFCDTLEQLELISAIATTIILTNLNELLERYNKIEPTQYSLTNYQSVHSVRTVHLQSHTPNFATQSPFLNHVQFLAGGDVKAIKEISSGYGIIEKIVSPGRIGQGVDVDINLG